MGLNSQERADPGGRFAIWIGERTALSRLQTVPDVVLGPGRGFAPSLTDKRLRKGSRLRPSTAIWAISTHF
jgi:hypothetical protein